MSDERPKWLRGDKIGLLGVILAFISIVVSVLTNIYQLEIKAWLQVLRIGSQLGQYILMLIWMGSGSIITFALYKIRVWIHPISFDKGDFVVRLTSSPNIVVNYDQDVLEANVCVNIKNFSDRTITIYSAKCEIRIGSREFLSFENIEKVTMKAKGECAYVFKKSQHGSVEKKIKGFFVGSSSERCGTCTFRFSVDIPGMDVIEGPAQPACIGLNEVGGSSRREARQ